MQRIIFYLFEILMKQQLNAKPFSYLPVCVGVIRVHACVCV